jgi:TonB family protein
MRLRVLAIVLALAGLPSAAIPQQVTQPDWLKKPSVDQLFAVFPTEAGRRGISGKAVLECEVTAQGALRACKVMSETPPGMGFGQAALSLAPQFLMKPQMVDGKPVGGAMVRLPINFKTEGLMSGPGVVPVVTQPVWLSAPTVRQVVEQFPEKAIAKRQSGRTTMNCEFKSDGSLRNCHTINEHPTGLGFADAARKLIPLFRGPARVADGRSVSGMRVQVPFNFPIEIADGEHPIIGQPRWLRLPNVDAAKAGFPKAAQDAHVEVGRVVMNCLVAAEGRLTECVVKSEDPKGYGFDKAALALSADFQVGQWSDEGLPTVGGRLNVPLRYQLHDDAPTAPSPATEKPK